jgi:hypothetical protein
LPMAAAKASVDMARARRIREMGFTVRLPVGLYDTTTRPRARL